MTMEITETRMSSLVTRHTAERDGDGWRVTWLPGRLVTRDQAITALTIAELAATGQAVPGTRNWTAITEWAAELGLTAEHAVAMAGTSALLAIAAAIYDTLAVPVPARYDDREACADLLAARVSIVRGVLGHLIESPDAESVAARTIRNAADQYPVTYTTAEERDGGAE